MYPISSAVSPASAMAARIASAANWPASCGAVMCVASQLESAPTTSASGVAPRAQRMLELLEHEHRAALAERHALPIGAKRPARLCVHRAQRIESGIRGQRETVRAAGQRDINLAGSHGIAAPARSPSPADAHADEMRFDRSRDAASGARRPPPARTNDATPAAIDRPFTRCRNESRYRSIPFRTARRCCCRRTRRRHGRGVTRAGPPAPTASTAANSAKRSRCDVATPAREAAQLRPAAAALRRPRACVAR